MDPSAPIQLANILDSVGKSTFSKIRKRTQFKGDRLKASEDIAHKVAKCLYGHELAPHQTNVCKIRRLYGAISPLVFNQITTFNLGILTNFNAFDLAVLTDFRLLVPVTSLKTHTRRRVIRMIIGYHGFVNRICRV